MVPTRAAAGTVPTSSDSPMIRPRRAASLRTRATTCASGAKDLAPLAQVVREREALVEVDGVLMAAPVARLLATPGEIRHAGRPLGADTDAALAAGAAAWLSGNVPPPGAEPIAQGLEAGQGDGIQPQRHGLQGQRRRFGQGRQLRRQEGFRQWKRRRVP